MRSARPRTWESPRSLPRLLARRALLGGDTRRRQTAESSAPPGGPARHGRRPRSCTCMRIQATVCVCVCACACVCVCGVCVCVCVCKLRCVFCFPCCLRGHVPRAIFIAPTSLVAPEHGRTRTAWARWTPELVQSRRNTRASAHAGADAGHARP